MVYIAVIDCWFKGFAPWPACRNFPPTSRHIFTRVYMYLYTHTCTHMRHRIKGINACDIHHHDPTFPDILAC